MQTVEYRRVPAHKLTEIKPLWEELNKIHLVDSVYFKEHYVTFSFDKRSAPWLKLPEENFYLLVAETEDSIPVGYCVSTIDTELKGEIDSLFVTPAFREQGIGRTLIEKSRKWLESNQCQSIRLAVSYGHESVMGFYQRLGFYPRLTILKWKNTNNKEKI
jgi:diamine N-acetyltransferase